MPVDPNTSTVMNTSQISESVGSKRGFWGFDNSDSSKSGCNPDILSWSNINLQYVFYRLFKFAIDFPMSQKENFNDDDILDKDKILKQKKSLKKSL